MVDPRLTKRAERSPGFEAACMIRELSNIHQAWFPNAPPLDLDDPSLDGDTMLATMLRDEESGKALTAVAALRLALAYATRAKLLDEQGGYLLAWSYVVDCTYIVGRLSGGTLAPGDSFSAVDAGRLGGKASHVETDAMAAEVRTWCEQRLAQYSSLNKLRDGVIAERLNAAKADTVRGWLTNWAKEWRAAGLWPH